MSDREQSPFDEDLTPEELAELEQTFKQFELELTEKASGISDADLWTEDELAILNEPLSFEPAEDGTFSARELASDNLLSAAGSDNKLTTLADDAKKMFLEWAKKNPNPDSLRPEGPWHKIVRFLIDTEKNDAKARAWAGFKINGIFVRVAIVNLTPNSIQRLNKYEKFRRGKESQQLPCPQTIGPNEKIAFCHFNGSITAGPRNILQHEFMGGHAVGGGYSFAIKANNEQQFSIAFFRDPTALNGKMIYETNMTWNNNPKGAYDGLKKGGMTVAANGFKIRSVISGNDAAFIISEDK